MIEDRNRIYDGWTSLENGVDSGRPPNTLDPTQVAGAENITFRGGNPKPRPGFTKLAEYFTNGTHSYNLNGTDAGFIPPYTEIAGQRAYEVYKTGVFQCVTGYSPHHGEDCLMAMIGGRLFKIVPHISDAKVEEIFPITNPSGPDWFHTVVFPHTAEPAPPTRNRSDSTIAYMVQADKWLIVQDGESKPIVYDGKTARRSNLETTTDKTEIPVGTIMAYGMGRIVNIVNDRDVSFGDLFGSHTGDDPSDSLILFTERNFLTGGFDAAIPFQQGVATGMAFFPQLDTSTGNGQLMVFAERGASSFFMSLPRELWQTSAFQIFALLTTGLRGHRSISTVNEDLWFRADDGIRTYRQARSEQSGWAHIPLSTSVSKFIDNDTKSLLKYSSSIYFDNRVLFTVNPVWNQGRPYHTGMVVVDFDILSSFGTKARPAWDGHWTNMAITQLVTANINGTTRAFIFGIDPDGYNQLYEISIDNKDDWGGQLIPWELEHRSYDFTKLSQQGNPFNESELYDADLWVSGITHGTVLGSTPPPPPPGRQPPPPRPPPPGPPPRP